MKNNLRFEKLNKKYHSTTIRFFISSLLINSLLILIPLLLIGLYSIFRTAKESAQAAEKKASLILNQVDDTLETFYTHVDNAYLFFTSNPRVTLQLKQAFSEKSLSLDSIKSAENISLNFQNLIYTDDYLQNIYVYFQNDYHRIFAPLHARLISISPDTEARLMSTYYHAGSDDVWMELSDEPLLYSEYSSLNLRICRKLYRRATDVQNGLILFSFHADKLENKLRSLLEYENQQIFLLNSDGSLVWPDSRTFSKSELLALSKELSDAAPETASPETPVTVNRNYKEYTATYLHSPRSYGLSYLLLTPKNKIYETTISLTSMYIFITLVSIGIACLLAYLKTRHDYKYLSKIIQVFSAPEEVIHKHSPAPKGNSSPFEYILLNVIHLFMEQDYLKIQDSEKAAKLQLSKMQALQHQINPHFLHNTLNNIYWESVKLTGSENQCSKMISDLSAIMRYSLSDPQEDVPVRSELDYLRKYLDIMKLRYSDKFHVQFYADEICLSCPIKKMLLQPLTENAIYHGIKEKPGKGLLSISVHRKHDRLYFQIYDTGNGIPPEKLKRIQADLKENRLNTNEHIGLLNTNSRLVLSYGPDSELHINSVYQKFTVIWFSIPLASRSNTGNDSHPGV
ncbi:MAG: histidine kinase [Lachnospiraceae bacterium]|nr:histidine kinase [Lachnospiraceae bacterium]